MLKTDISSEFRFYDLIYREYYFPSLIKGKFPFEFCLSYGGQKAQIIQSFVP
jgi:hypothetical protein